MNLAHIVALVCYIKRLRNAFNNNTSAKYWGWLHSTILCTVYSHMDEITRATKKKNVMKTPDQHPLFNRTCFALFMEFFFESSTPIKILRRLKSCPLSLKGSSSIVWMEAKLNNRVNSPLIPLRKLIPKKRYAIRSRRLIP